MKTDGYTFENMRFAYIAGLFDGEGSIGLYENAASSRAYLRIKIDNTNKAPLQFIKDALGGNIIERAPAEKRWKICYMWRINGMLAAEVLEKLLPYLIIKQERAVLGIEYMGASEERKSEIAVEMRKLNERGSGQ